MMPPARFDRPNRVPWPPLILLGGLGSGLLADRLLVLSFSPGVVGQVVGFGVACLGIILDLTAVATMMRHRANVLPHRPASGLVTTGPFALSRNPIYLGNSLLLAGLGIGLGKAWLLLAAIAAALLVWRLAILPEEQHLQARFGAAYEAYARRTPRWFGLPRRR